MAGAPCSAAFKLTNNSGTEVAKDTTVRPMTILDRFNLKDKPTEARTKYSPPTTRSKNPKIINKTSMVRIFNKYRL